MKKRFFSRQNFFEGKMTHFIYILFFSSLVICPIIYLHKVKSIHNLSRYLVLKFFFNIYYSFKNRHFCRIIHYHVKKNIFSPLKSGTFGYLDIFYRTMGHRCKTSVKLFLRMECTQDLRL